MVTASVRSSLVVVLVTLAPVSRAWDPSYVPPAPPPRYETVTIQPSYTGPIIQPMQPSGGGGGWSPGGWTSGGAPVAPAAPSDGELCTGGDREACERACQKSGKVACGNLALLRMRGDGGPVDRPGAHAAAVRGCALGDEWSCWARAELEIYDGIRSPDRWTVEELLSKPCHGAYPRACWLLATRREAQLPGIVTTPAQLDDWFGRACKAGEPAGCGDLARRRAEAERPVSDGTLAELERVCGAGDHRACTWFLRFARRDRPLGPELARRARPLVERACSGGHRDGCVELATLVEDDDAPRARRLLEEGCEARHGLSCAGLAWLHARGRAGLADDPARVTALAKKACELGDGWGCYEVALREAGPGRAPDAKKVARACELGSGAACDAVAREGFDSGDASRVRRAFEQVAARCRRGDAEACALEAWAWWGGRGTLRSPSEAIRAETWACGGGVEAACATLAWAKARGVGTRGDPERARAMLQPLCDKGLGRPCLVWGELLADGLGGPADPAAAFAAFTRSCDAGDAAGCAAKGRALATGMGVTADARAGRRLVEATCKRPSDPGCVTLADLLAGQRAEATRARALYQKSCDAGQHAACAGLAEVMLRGIGGKVDGARAIALARPACAASEGRACRVLGDAQLAERWSGLVARVKAELFWRRACDAGDAPTCRALDAMERAGSMTMIGERVDVSGSVVVPRSRGTWMPPTDCPSRVIEACRDGHVQACLVESERLFETEPTRAYCGARAACDKGSGLGCALAALHARPYDEARAVADAERGCRAGHRPGCALAAMLGLGILDAQVAPAKVERAVTLVGPACEQGEPSACDALVQLAHHAALPLADARAWPALGKACERGGAGACEAVARREAMLRLRAACERGDADACDRFGWASYQPYRFGLDRAAGARALARGCELGSWQACMRAVELAQREDLRERAGALAEAACARGTVPGAGGDADDPHVPKPDPIEVCVVAQTHRILAADDASADADARATLEPMCDKGVWSACLPLTAIWVVSRPGAFPKSTGAVIARACKKLGGEVCDVADFRRVMLDTITLCDGGDLEACGHHAYLHGGLGTYGAWGFPRRAARLQAEACRRGHAASCQ
ncbi:MAG: sel1 repeat family protein [Deltaproteobacteria bacterium]|nr:sel1 repeat family protein [Deltaproteobacteria bacterium]